MFPVTEQTAGVLDATVTGSPELAAGDTGSEPAESVWLLGALNVMVCGFCYTCNVCVTGTAAV
jgi:hypothetical protein